MKDHESAAIGPLRRGKGASHSFARNRDVKMNLNSGALSGHIPPTVAGNGGGSAVPPGSRPPDHDTGNDDLNPPLDRVVISGCRSFASVWRGIAGLIRSHFVTLIAFAGVVVAALIFAMYQWGWQPPSWFALVPILPAGLITCRPVQRIRADLSRQLSTGSIEPTEFVRQHMLKLPGGGPPGLVSAAAALRTNGGRGTSVLIAESADDPQIAPFQQPFAIQPLAQLCECTAEKRRHESSADGRRRTAWRDRVTGRLIGWLSAVGMLCLVGAAYMAEMLMNDHISWLIVMPIMALIAMALYFRRELFGTSTLLVAPQQLILKHHLRAESDKLSLFTRSDSVLLAVPDAIGIWYVIVANGTETETVILSRSELDIVLAAWLSPCPSKRPCELSVPE